MAKISNFKVDSKKITDGDWVRPGEEFDDLEINTRGFTDQYNDARAAKLRRAAVSAGTSVDKLPAAKVREITVECLIAHVLLDVRNLNDENENPVSFTAFCTLLRDPDYTDLFSASLIAATKVGKMRGQHLEDATGN